MSSLLPRDEPNCDETLFRSLLSHAESSDIPLQLVRAGISSEDISTMGLAFAMLHNPQMSKRIVPACTFNDYQLLHLRYLPRCIIGGRTGEWIELPYLAAHATVRWFLHLWEQKGENLQHLDAWKAALARVYAEGDLAIRECVVYGVLEHLFPRSDIRDFFADWLNRADLRGAYEQATKLVEG